jgi:hypothetical protein
MGLQKKICDGIECGMEEAIEAFFIGESQAMLRATLTCRNTNVPSNCHIR